MPREGVPREGVPREWVPRGIKPGFGQGAESEAPKEYCIAINNLVNVGIWNKFMNFIFGMRKYFRNSGVFKILYGYSALFLCIYMHFYMHLYALYASMLPAFFFLLQMLHRCATCVTCCMCCVACEWTIHELHMQHVQHVACNIYSP